MNSTYYRQSLLELSEVKVFLKLPISRTALIIILILIVHYFNNNSQILIGLISIEILLIHETIFRLAIQNKIINTCLASEESLVFELECSPENDPNFPELGNQVSDFDRRSIFLLSVKKVNKTCRKLKLRMLSLTVSLLVVVLISIFI